MEFEHAEELLNTEYELKTKNSILAHDLKADTFGIRNSLNSLVDFFDQKPIETNKSDLEILYQNSILLSDDVERLSAGLEPDPKIWLTRLKKMLKRLKEDPGIIIKIEVSDIIDTSISPFIGHRIYTILRVLVDNVLNHSKADLLKINTFYEPDILTIMVEDNGNGGFKFPEDAGVGLTSVIRRVKELGGTSVVDTNNKTKFTLKIPVKKLSENE